MSDATPTANSVLLMDSLTCVPEGHSVSLSCRAVLGGAPSAGYHSTHATSSPGSKLVTHQLEDAVQRLNLGSEIDTSRDSDLEQSDCMRLPVHAVTREDDEGMKPCASG